MIFCTDQLFSSTVSCWLRRQISLHENQAVYQWSLLFSHIRGINCTACPFLVNDLNVANGETYVAAASICVMGATINYNSFSSATWPATACDPRHAAWTRSPQISMGIMPGAQEGLWDFGILFANTWCCYALLPHPQICWILEGALS